MIVMTCPNPGHPLTGASPLGAPPLGPDAPGADAVPDWLPPQAQLYLSHVKVGRSIRDLARAMGLHPSTVLRRIRAFELRRDDPLIDELIGGIEQAPPKQPPRKDPPAMTAHMTAPLRASHQPDEATIASEGRRILRRLCETGAILAIAPDMERAAVLKGAARTATLDRTVAQAFALRDWIAVRATQGRVTTYDITVAGKAALKRLMLAAEPDGRLAPGYVEARSPFAEQHRDWAERPVMEPDHERDRDAEGATEAGPEKTRAAGTERPRVLRYNLAESPFAALGRRRDKDGKPFLDPDHITAGERLREDFELAQMGPRVAQNWDRFLTGGERGTAQDGPDTSLSSGPGRARARVAAALRDLGPGLGDVVLRCCCFLEGIEVCERRMGWSARSGKIVLRIALSRLKRHYDEQNGGRPPLIG